MIDLVIMAVAGLACYCLYRLGLQRIQVGRRQWLVALELALYSFALICRWL